MGEIVATELNQLLEPQIFHLIIKEVENYSEDLDELCAEAHLNDAIEAMRIS